MTKKQKKMLVRIIITAIPFLILFACEQFGLLEPIEGTWIDFLIFLILYLIVGYDIVYKAFRNIKTDRSLMKTF